MNVYRSQINKWKELLATIKDDNMEQIANIFVDQLKNDNVLLNKNEPISDCAYNAPRLHSSLDKKYSIAHKIAFIMFPIEDDDKKDISIRKKFSYIQYQRVLSKLSKVFVDQIEKEDALKKSYKEVRKNTQRKYFCELKNRPLDKLIINPTPMPVNISSAEELQPFFDHLSSNKVIDVDQKEFLRGVEYSDGRMDLCKQVVGPPHIKSLMNSLKNNSHIKHFLLGNNIIGINGAKAISEFLNNPHIPEIKTWYLAGNELDSECMKLLSDALKNDTVCESLWLKRNPIKPEGAKYLAEMLESNKTIKILDLHNTGILDEGVKYICQALEKNNTLKHLYLDANGVTVEGAKYIANYFNYLVNNNLKGVTSLWLDINRLDDEGAIILANSLSNYKYLKRLVVGSNRLSHIGCKAICESLVNSKNLIVLDLGLYKSTSDLGELPNNIGDEGVKYISEFIRNNKSVKVLSILHNNINGDGISEITNALNENSNIVWLYYEQYGLCIVKNIRDRIKDKLSENIRLHYNCNIDDFCNNKLRYIRGSKKLKYIDSVYRNKM